MQFIFQIVKENAGTQLNLVLKIRKINRISQLQHIIVTYTEKIIINNKKNI